ncbi:hypothetical protein [Treponema sp. C6A8]|uniref:hypothetical protein n=1 Tax=Treponema sp. C6A8 TaxID=1410609 RepID=UPI000489DA0D|nr:hypothetical protein [Treponema sp. C6A8]
MIKSGKNSLAFSYKAGNSFIHKMPPVAKILLIPFVNILVFNLPFEFSLGFLIFQAALAFAIKFTLREQLRDLRPVLYYAVILYVSGFIANLCAALTAEDGTGIWKEALYQSFIITFKNHETFKMLVKLFCVMQSASILFKTSTTLQIREGIGVIETAIRKILPVSKKNTLTDTIALFICFIPMVYKNWQLSKRAWLARGGRSGIKMMKSIFPVFFSVGIKQAYNAARAVAVRRAE